MPRAASGNPMTSSIKTREVIRIIAGSWSKMKKRTLRIRPLRQTSPNPVCATQKLLSAGGAPPEKMFDHELPPLSSPSP